jgi:hypothetical protein
MSGAHEAKRSERGHGRPDSDECAARASDAHVVTNLHAGGHCRDIVVYGAKQSGEARLRDSGVCGAKARCADVTPTRKTMTRRRRKRKSCSQSCQARRWTARRRQSAVVSWKSQALFAELPTTRAPTRRRPRSAHLAVRGHVHVHVCAPSCVVRANCALCHAHAHVQHGFHCGVYHDHRCWCHSLCWNETRTRTRTWTGARLRTWT